MALEEDNKKLQETMSDLVIQLNLSEDKRKAIQGALRVQIQNLKKKNICAANSLEGKLQKAKAKGQSVDFMEKGIYTDEAREIGWILVYAGCALDKVGPAMKDVFEAAGITVHGPVMDKRTVRRTILEGYIMSEMQLGMELSQASDFTMSSDSNIT